MTPQEIDMFAKATEIQEGWKPKVGDSYTLSPTYNEFKSNKNYAIYYVTKENLSHIIFCRKSYIFLPSIEQMAEMWHEGCNGNHQSFFMCLGRFADKCPSIWIFNTIVLAFIMYELFSKQWSEEKREWV